ncbi:unnamed protein product [Effrenium voratum]|uniref:Acyltransferase n=1 Tax=Effrenium voratum TaxID=2562239 RepID=A0AA36IB72_9DINO|nr:unnamed protein product [Effrenium voratum]
MCLDGCFLQVPWPCGASIEDDWDQLDLDYDMEASPFNLLLVPPICTATLYRAKEIPLDFLKGRVRQIVEANPWLGGRLRKSCGRPFLAVPPSPGNHFMECSSSFTMSSGADFHDLSQHVLESEATLKCGLLALNQNEQLFRVAVIPANPDHFLLVVSLNHTIGDGYTFYKLYSMLEPNASILQMNPLRQSGFACLAEQCIGESQFNWLTTCPTMLGLLRSFCLWHPPKPEVRYVDQDWLASLKSQDASLSTNDILTSHLLTKSRFGYGYMSINLRNRGLGADDANAGNYVHRVHLAPGDFAEPDGVRKSISEPFRFRGQDAVPGCWESITTSHGLVSNWASLFYEVSLPGSQHLSHMPILSYPQPGFGLLLIFKPRRDELAVYYYIRNKAAFEDASSSPMFGSSFNPFA